MGQGEGGAVGRSRMSQQWGWGETVGKDSRTEAGDEVLALVLSLNLSGDSGKSLHFPLLPHLQHGNKGKLKL